MNDYEEQKEVISGRVRLQNIIASYLVELNEYRSNLYMAIKFGKKSPSYFQDFIQIFKKIYDLTSTTISDEKLKVEIDEWFRNADDNKLSKEEGLLLSLAYQKSLESENILSLFEEPISPPFVFGEKL